MTPSMLVAAVLHECGVRDDGDAITTEQYARATLLVQRALDTSAERTRTRAAAVAHERAMHPCMAGHEYAARQLLATERDINALDARGDL